jgi:hypothetical protein
MPTEDFDFDWHKPDGILQFKSNIIAFTGSKEWLNEEEED